MSAARAAAVAALAQVLDERRSLDAALSAMRADLRLGADDRGLVQELCYGVLRWFWALEYQAKQHLTTRIRHKDRDIRRLILIGIYELQEAVRPVHAVVSETVNTCAVLGKPWTKGLVNAVLRSFVRAGPAPDPGDADLQVHTAHPLWLVGLLQRDWPTRWPGIVAANNSRPPMALRVNRRLVTRRAYLAELARAGFSASASPWCRAGIVLDQPVPVERLPGFAAGRVSVQDIAAQLVGALLDLAPGQRVLDACSAPGGKAAHALELEPGIELVALEKDPHRSARTQATFNRLQLHARLCRGDARYPKTWHRGPGFDRILVDAPCSGTGVIRRHPDIKHLRRAADIAAAAQVQGEMLSGLWPLVRPGGRLVYVTCSILSEETQDQVAAFAARCADAHAVPVELPVGVAAGLGHQILPGDGNLDGFFYATFARRS